MYYTQPSTLIEADRLMDLTEFRQCMGGIGRTNAYRLWQSGEVPTVYVGGRRFAKASDVYRYIASLQPV